METSKDDDEHFCNKCKSTIVGLDTYVAHRKAGTCLLEQPKDPDSTTETAADALASEAAFMENIGLYLNPKLLNPNVLQRGLSSTPSKSSIPFASGSNWEDDLVLEWPKEDALPSTSKSTPSLMSYLKFKQKDDDKEPASHEEFGASQADFLNFSNTEELASHDQSGRWRLWHPEQEQQQVSANEDMWNEVLESAAAAAVANDIYLETVANDPTLMEMSASTNLSVKPCDNQDAVEDLFCADCDRQLSDRKNYEKHLQSELHFKRSSIKIDEPKKSRTPLVVKPTTEEDLTEPVSRSEEGQFRTCKSCQSLVDSHQFGKHLISHYHHHRSKDRKDENRNLVLENIHAIVKEAPFQCDICSYYFNWNQELIDHWRHYHAKEETNEGQQLWCSFCRFQSNCPSQFLSHLESEDHHEIVSVINRSVPMHIKKLNLQKCHLCEAKFRLRFTLRSHVKAQHQIKNFQLENHEFLRCHWCSFSTFSGKSLTAHQFLVHPNEKSLKYKCNICMLKFTSNKQAITHRNSISHKEKVKLRKGDLKHLSCLYCDENQANKSQLKDHIWSKHEELTSQCGLCGDRFAIPQELGAHARGHCGTKGRKVVQSLKCPKCKFSTSSPLMLDYHRSLKHGRNTCFVCKAVMRKPQLWEHILTHGPDLETRKCAVCHRIFSNSTSLKNHQEKGNCESKSFECNLCDFKCISKSVLNKHFNGKHQDSSCDICNQTFSQSKGLKEHMKTDHSLPTVVLKCSQCSYSTTVKRNLRKHEISHSEGGQKVCDSCDFTCKRSSELKRHQQLKHNSDDGTFKQCPDCDYRTYSKQHLERHQASVHSKASENFQCRLCNYSSSSMDNLRKHILKTAAHPGTKVYSCESCIDFQTNETSEFKLHLSTKHRDLMSTPHSVKVYIKDYFNSNVKTKSTRKQTLVVRSDH